MIQDLVAAIILYTQTSLENPNFALPKQEQVLASREISLETRYANPSVNDVMKDNILLTLAYLNGDIKPGTKIDWNKLNQNSHYEFKLAPKETFAFQDDVLPEYENKVAFTTNAHFNAQDGFKTDGYLYGDGVCHLASLLNWVARDAKLDVKSPTAHDFASIPEVPKEYGTSIYYNSGAKDVNSAQNLYITNNQEKPVALKFDYENGKLKFSISEI
ncbi:MAG: VanW family protein [Candidatus Daviesbacteria bacterium]|nr:VanW family protein [Candidatus Daviesbacteria bacterium]